MTTSGSSKTDQEESSRMWSTASFVGVLIIIGLPLWWKTTEVYRVALPYDEIAAFKNEPNVVATELTILAYDEPTAAEVKGLIVEAFEDSDILNVKVTSSLLPKDLHDSINSSADEEGVLALVCRTLDCGRSNHLFLVQRRPMEEHVWLADERVVLFKDSLATATLIKVLKSWIYAEDTLRGSREERSIDAARKTRFAPASGYRIVTTIVHPKPQELTVEFDAGDAVEDYIGTFVDELSLLHNFTLKSQWLHLMEFDFQAKQISTQTTDPIEWNRYFAVKQSRLHLLLTHAEERTATRVSELPTVNLLLYVMPCHEAPVRIVDHNNIPIQSPVEAFMSPKWGGVFIASPPFAVCHEVQNGRTPTWRPCVRLVMGTFIAQLRSLLGIVEAEPIEGAYLDPLRSVKPRKWEVDSLMRVRTLEQLVSAQLTLQSLAQLLKEISNIVINDEVGASIKGAVASIQAGRRHLASASLETAHSHSQRAFLEADSAFTHPTLLALLYFPHDQKYAIYIPLFMPVMFPVLLSLKNLLSWMRGKKGTKAKTD